MKRTNAAGATDTNLFTDGDPELEVEATVVDASWLNLVQEEICNVVEGSGATLDSGDDGQLLTAIQLLVQKGAVALASFTIANNTAVAANVTGLVFDKTTIRKVSIPFSLHRQTATPIEYDVFGTIHIWYKPVAAAWQISVVFGDGDVDEIGVVFSVTSAGQIQYTSTNLAGGSYVGQLRVSGVQQIKV